MTLPGLEAADPERAAKTLEDQVAAILDLIAQHGNQPALLVAHSGANAPVSLVIDRPPEPVHGAVCVDSGPVATGSVVAPALAVEVEGHPLPPSDTPAQ